MDSCAVCGLKIVDVSGELCAIHIESYRNLIEGYASWSNAYGTITRADFLERLAARSETGLRIKETAQFLIKNPARWK